MPLFPGRVMLVAGHWLTEVQEEEGGALIDPDFSDEIVIHFRSAPTGRCGVGRKDTARLSDLFG